MGAENEVAEAAEAREEEKSAASSGAAVGEAAGAAGAVVTAGLGELFVSFLKMGAVLIGGGYALLPLLEHEIVDRRGWAKSEEMIDLYALAQLLPGVIAVNTAMLVGQRLRGFKGTLVAAAGLTAVPFVLIAAYAAAYGMLRETTIFATLLEWIQPAMAGMVLGLGYNMVRKTATGSVATALAVTAAAVVLVFNPGFGYLIIAAAILGGARGILRVKKANTCERP